jgi:endonuclease YncB( thermonuclease family)
MAKDTMNQLAALAVAALVATGVLFADLRASSGVENAVSGRVVGVVDGDTLDILTTDKQNLRIRLWGIDAPEKSQPFGQASKHQLSRLAYNCTATVEVMDTDRYGRHVGLVHACGSDLNEAMIRTGHAWVYRKYVEPSHASRWLEMEKHAKDARKGLWGSSEPPIAPWSWREGERG